jgi:hypothetical protein
MIRTFYGFIGVLVLLLISVAPISAPPFTLGNTTLTGSNLRSVICPLGGECLTGPDAEEKFGKNNFKSYSDADKPCGYGFVGEFNVPKFCYGVISSSECIDTDGGLNYDVKGSVAGYEDVCSPFDDQILFEYTAEVDEINDLCTAIENSYECDSLCEDGRCLPPTCDDWIQNQGETGIDCGGPCDPCDCPLGYKCVTGFEAEDKFGEGSYVTSSDDVCGSEVIGEIDVPKFCYGAISSSECIDTDGGWNPDVKGSVGDCTDTCSLFFDNEILNECFIADKDEISGRCTVKSQFFECNSVCEDGECLPKTCYDLIQNQGETSIDSGGPCPTSVSCTWCGENVEPIYVRGQYDKGFIDIVFVPHISYQGNFELFIRNAKKHIRDGYFKLDEWAVDPLPSDYKDKFNFYYYTGGFGDTPEDVGCAGELPSNFWSTDHADFADIGAMLQNVEDKAGCATGGPPGHFRAKENTGVVMHETGHVLFGLADNYCGCRAGLWQNATVPNLWSSLASCQADASNEGWTMGNCVSICETDESEQGGPLSDCQAPNPEKDFNFWQYDPDPSVMGNPPGSRPIGEAATRRINYVFDNWPAGSSKGFLIWLNIKDNIFTEISSEITDAHPDIGFEQDHFRVDILSEDSRLLRSFDLWDPRVQMDGDLPVEMGSFSLTGDDTDFPLRFPWYKNLKKFNIIDKSSGELMITVDLTATINDFCNENPNDSDCEGKSGEEKSSDPTSSTTTSTVGATSTTTIMLQIADDAPFKPSNFVIILILLLLVVILYLVNRFRGQEKK